MKDIKPKVNNFQIALGEMVKTWFFSIFAYFCFSFPVLIAILTFYRMSSNAEIPPLGIVVKMMKKGPGTIS